MKFFHFNNYFYLKLYKLLENLEEKLQNFEGCWSPIRFLFATINIVLLTTLSFVEIWCIFIPYYYLVLPKFISIPIIFIANWILFLFYYNIFMVKTTHAGTPNQKLFVFDGVNFCNKCKLPKPMRSHHCALCNTCILKMDHHCPWLNQCIGFYNHRYFYVLMAIYVVGSAILYVAGYPIFAIIYTEVKYTLEKTRASYTYYELVKELFILEDFFKTSNFYFDVFNFNNPWERTKFLFPLVLNIPLFALQFALFCFHTSLITKGETAIELHINRTGRFYAKQKGLVYTNFFDHGSKKNWMKFLGVDSKKSFFWNILFPCKYRPLEDGHTWERAERKNFVYV